jgi:hypothetical protein
VERLNRDRCNRNSGFTSRARASSESRDGAATRTGA